MNGRVSLKGNGEWDYTSCEGIQYRLCKQISRWEG